MVLILFVQVLKKVLKSLKFELKILQQPWNTSLSLWFYIERTEDSFVGASQKDLPPLRLRQRSPELPLLGPQNSAAITPLDTARFQSRTVRSAVRKLRQGEEEQADVATPGQEEAKGALQKDSSLQLDTPSRFLSRDKLFGPSFNTKVSRIWEEI